jgi:hypothetical protein
VSSYKNFFTGEIPSKALGRIEGKIQLDSSEKVLVYLNHSTFRFGASGTIFTNKRAINYSMRSVNPFPYVDVKNIRLSNLDLNFCEIWVESENSVQFGKMVSEAHEEFIKTLSPYVKITLGQREIDSESLEKRKSIIDRLKEKEPSDWTSLILKLPVQIDTGGKLYAKKVLGGLLTGGMAAAVEDKFHLEAVMLPDKCCLCGLFEGTKQMTSGYHFKRGSGASKLTGVNLEAGMTMDYKVCELCVRENLQAIHITDFQKSGVEWYLSLSILNPETARRISDANKPVDSIPSSMT